ncbi:ribosomal L7Ae/L30e/S12e/Gadd45 family protein [Candidatus Micrarchaeota archaeon]|nr:ribosomal L7Ae/L30e/S12e/Gadd45 family protein [Candidatus Micrarchaeota archaeon]MBU1930929.1 ribosomal L7Ae/L30e/S12e/Gadd45 family protein [Candidatus Micrarchaeota archaeon]
MTDLNVSVPKELQEKVLQLVEKAAKSKKLRLGINEVTKMVERGQAKFVIVAQDVSPPEIVLHVPVLCQEKSIPVGLVSSKKELGEKAGLKVGTSALAIMDEGDYKKEWDVLSKRFAELK